MSGRQYVLVSREGGFDVAASGDRHIAVGISAARASMWRWHAWRELPSGGVAAGATWSSADDRDTALTRAMEAVEEA